mmetsp:Transcript_4286/g.6851  ORF Transcript_4286/g.6851 Transcript_4286/m.6851 type:complete len:200 (+) Transcript_4286:615-1214(+)
MAFTRPSIHSSEVTMPSQAARSTSSSDLGLTMVRSRRPSGVTLLTQTCTICPGSTWSSIFPIKSWDIRETWTIPFLSAPTSTKHPNSTTFKTMPVSSLPTSRSFTKILPSPSSDHASSLNRGSSSLTARAATSLGSRVRAEAEAASPENEKAKSHWSSLGLATAARAAATAKPRRQALGKRLEARGSLLSACGPRSPER